MPETFPKSMVPIVVVLVAVVDVAVDIEPTQIDLLVVAVAVVVAYPIHRNQVTTMRPAVYAYRWSHRALMNWTKPFSQKL